MKLLILFLIITMSFSNTYAKSTLATPEIEIISAEKLQKMQQEIKELIVIDSRGGRYFDGIVIKGAINLPVTDVTAKSLAKVIATKSTPVVFYCANKDCPASSLAAYKAKEHGYTKLYKYEGGIEEWVSKKLPTEINNINMLPYEK